MQVLALGSAFQPYAEGSIFCKSRFQTSRLQWLGPGIVNNSNYRLSILKHGYFFSGRLGYVSQSCKKDTLSEVFKSQAWLLFSNFFNGPERKQGEQIKYVDGVHVHIEQFMQHLARITVLAFVLLTIPTLRFRGRLCKAAIAAPVSLDGQRATLEANEKGDTAKNQEEISVKLGEQIDRNLREMLGMEEKIQEIEMEKPLRKKRFERMLQIEEMLKDLEVMHLSLEGSPEKDAKIQAKLEECQNKIREAGRQLQGIFLTDMEAFVSQLEKEEVELREKLEKLVNNYGTLGRLPSKDINAEKETKEEFEATWRKYVSLKAEKTKKEFEGWYVVSEEIPHVQDQSMKALESFAIRNRSKSKHSDSEEIRMRNDFMDIEKKIILQRLLPLAVNVKDPEILDEELRRLAEAINLETIKSKEMQVSFENNLKKLLQSEGRETLELVNTPLEEVVKGMPPVGLRRAFGDKIVDVPDIVGLNAALGWKKWCAAQKAGLKEYLLENPEIGRQYVAGKQEKILLSRDRVLTQSWFDQRYKRWEMSPMAAAYAVSKKLVEHARIRQDRQIIYMNLKGDSREFAVSIKGLDMLLEEYGGFDIFCLKMIALNISTTLETMWIPLREWDPLKLLLLPVEMGYSLLLSIWNAEVIAAIRDLYVNTLIDAAEEVVVRFCLPIIQVLPKPVRVIFRVDLPDGVELSEPTAVMIWQQEAEKKLSARSRPLPWWMDLPLRCYLIGAPLLLIVPWLLRASVFLGPTPFVPNKYDRQAKLESKVHSEVMPRVRELNSDPIKRAFGRMKRIRRPPVPLKDFVGIDSIKEEVKEIVNFLKDPESFKDIGARPPRGVLIVGESGTGKSTLALAIAAEAKVPLVELSTLELKGGKDWVGQGASNVREIFKTARQLAPLVLFFDDFHRFVGSRGQSTNKDSQEQEAVINQFLVELDGFETQEGVVLLATTSKPDAVDPALRRPGRMDRTIVLLPPDHGQREQILKQAAEGTMDRSLAKYVNWGEVSWKTNMLTFQDLQYVPLALERSSFSSKITDEEELFCVLWWTAQFDKYTPKWIRKTRLVQIWNEKIIDWLSIRPDKNDIETAVEFMDVYGKAKPGISLQDPGYPWTRETKLPHAVWAAGRGLVAFLLPNFDTVDAIGLDETSWMGIGFTRLSHRFEEGYQETCTETRSYMEKELVLCLSSYVACRLLLPFGENNNICKRQIEEAEKIATMMASQYGWSLDGSPMVYSIQGAPSFLNMGRRDKLEVAGKIQKLLDAAFNKAANMLKNNQHILELLVEDLITYENLTKKDMQRILQENGAVPEKEPFTLENCIANEMHKRDDVSAKIALLGGIR